MISERWDIEKKIVRAEKKKSGSSRANASRFTLDASCCLSDLSNGRSVGATTRKTT